MTNKLKILLLTSCCFILMGCPPGHFHEYEYIGNKLPYEGLSYTRIEYNHNADLYVRAGYYSEFINKKENGLAVVIKTNPEFDLSKNNIVKEVRSMVFGKLMKKDSLPYTVRVYHPENTLMYHLPFKNRNERKALKKIKKDTIAIALTNGDELIFVR